jgi:HEAT repeat protein
VLDVQDFAAFDDADALLQLRRWKDDREAASLLEVARSESFEFGRRWFAVRYLGEFDTADVIEGLAALLGDPEVRIRQRAAKSLREIGPPAGASVAALCEALCDGEGSVRIAAARALGEIGDRSALDALERAADTTAWDALHSWVTDSLVKLGSSEAPRHLVRRLSAEKAWQRRWAARQLRTVGDIDAVQPLREARGRDLLHRRTYTQAIRSIESRRVTS